jgi:hypothetical protein
VLIARLDTWACESPRGEEVRVAEPKIHATNPGCKLSRALVLVAPADPRFVALPDRSGPITPISDNRAELAFMEHSFFTVVGISVR